MPYTGRFSADPWLIPHKDPARHYRYISSRPARMGMWLQSYGDAPGYQLERGKTVDETFALAEKLGLNASYVDVNLNRIAYGDNVLASIPMEEHERRVTERLDEQLSRREAAVDAFHAAGEAARIRTFEEAPEETASRKRFHDRDEGERPFSGQTGVGNSPALRRRAATTPLPSPAA